MTSTTKDQRNTGADRTRRRAAQAANAEKAKVEGSQLSSPEGPEKQAAIAEKRAAAIAEIGGLSKGEIAKQRQAVNRKKADAELAALPQPAQERPQLVPGEQVDLNTARRMAMLHDREERDEITAAATAAGRAVRDTLLGSDLPAVEKRRKALAKANAAAAAADIAASNKTE